MKLTALAAATLLIIPGSIFAQSSACKDVPTTATAARPKQQGDKAPDATVRDSAGREIRLFDVFTSAPTVLIFFRGGWCPYCNTHLGKLATIEDELKQAGYQVVAITPDAPEKLAADAAKAKVGYTLLSDSQAEAICSYGLAFRVAPDVVSLYKDKYKIDLEQWSGGETHHILPVPAAYVIGRDATIKFAFSDPDYKKRVNEQELLAAAKKAAE